MTIGRGSFLSELVERAGGRNLFDDVAASAGTVSIEAVARRDPDLILTSGEGPVVVRLSSRVAGGSGGTRAPRDQGERLRVQPARPAVAARDQGADAHRHSRGGTMNRFGRAPAGAVVVCLHRRPERRHRPALAGRGLGRNQERRCTGVGHRPGASRPARAAGVHGRRKPRHLRRRAAGHDPEPARRALSAGAVGRCRSRRRDRHRDARGGPLGSAGGGVRRGARAPSPWSTG